jgi:DNA-binding NarL/FixJ family response regulator
MISVLIVDDHPVFRRGLTLVLKDYPDIKVVGEAVDGVEAVEKATEMQPSVIVMDIQMPRCSGVEATAALQQAAPDSKVLILTVSDKNQDIFDAMRAGAKGYVLKYVGIDELVDAIKLIAAGDVIISQSMAGKFIGSLGPSSEQVGDRSNQTLSKREIEVLQLVAKGNSTKVIADQLFLSESTIKGHLHNIMDKLHVKNRAQAVAKGINDGMLK